MDLTMIVLGGEHQKGYILYIFIYIKFYNVQASL
jgi:hypothetical protein